ncbi:MAG: hypothetical protein LBH68_01070, partial [Bifidobacteriaceae bacterium]|nr:hypothetical protein [Bifidobacteriaceae bacterium]
ANPAAANTQDGHQPNTVHRLGRWRLVVVMVSPGLKLAAWREQTPRPARNRFGAQPPSGQ